MQKCWANLEIPFYHKISNVIILKQKQEYCAKKEKQGQIQQERKNHAWNIKNIPAVPNYKEVSPVHKMNEIMWIKKL